MGTYRQPGLILDKSLGIIPEEIGKFQNQLMQSMKENRAAKQKARTNRAKQEIKDKKRELDTKIENEKYKRDIAGVGNIIDGNNQIIEPGKYMVPNANGFGKINSSDLTDPNSPHYLGNIPANAGLSDTDLDIIASNMVGEGGIESSMKIDLTHAVEQMSLHPQGTEERAKWKNEIDQLIKELPVLTNVFNQEASSHRPAFKFDGTALPSKAGMENRLLHDGQPQWDLRKQMESDIVFSTNPNRFTSIPPSLSPDGTSMIRYNNGTESINISYKRYMDLSENGGSIMGVTKAKPFNDMLKAVWDSKIKSNYDSISKYNSKKYEEGTSTITKRQTIKSFDKANALMKEQISAWIDDGGISSTKGSIAGYNYGQNIWQMMGGPDDGDAKNRIYTGTPEQNERAKVLMEKSMKLAYGSETSAINYGVTENEIEEEKLTKIESEALRIAREDGITLYPRGDGANAAAKKGNQKSKLEAINKVLELDPDNTKIDLEDIKTHWTALTKKPVLLANILNSIDPSPDMNSKLYYRGDAIGDALALQLGKTKLSDEENNAYYVKEPGGWEAKDFLNGYPAFQAEMLNALSKSKEYENVKKSNLKKTGLEDVKVVQVLPESTEEELRNFYRTQTT